MWNRLIAVVEEQAQTLMRTAFSTTVREAGDLSAGVFDLQGRMLAQAVTGTPGHVNSMAAVGRPFPQAVPGRRRCSRATHYLTNDPWLGTGHLYDFTVVTPAFQERPAGRRCSPRPPRRRHRRHRLRRRRPRRCSRKGCASRSCRWPRRARSTRPVAIVARQRARADPGRGRPLFARRLQRGRLPPPGRDDGRVRARRRSTSWASTSSATRATAMLDEIAQAAAGHLAHTHDASTATTSRSSS